MNENNLYSDFDLALTPHPLTGDLSPKKNVDAVKRAIKTIFSLNAYDIPFQPNYKSNMKEMLFEPATHLTEISIRTDIEWAVKKLEPRAKILDLIVKASADGLGYNITISFLIKSLMKEEQYTFFVKRVR